MPRPSKKQTFWTSGAVLAVVLAVIGTFRFDVSWNPLSVDHGDPGPPRKIHDQLVATARIYDHLYRWQAKIGSDKILILKAHDSGTPIPSRSTVIAEVIKNQHEPRLTSWQSQPLDGSYVEMLERMIINHRAINLVSEMEPGVLKNVYLAGGFEVSDVHLVGSTPDSLWYISIVFQKLPESFDEATKTFNPVHEDLMRSELHILRGTLRSIEAIR